MAKHYSTAAPSTVELVLSLVWNSGNMNVLGVLQRAVSCSEHYRKGLEKETKIWEELKDTDFAAPFAELLLPHTPDFLHLSYLTNAYFYFQLLRLLKNILGHLIFHVILISVLVYLPGWVLHALTGRSGGGSTSTFFPGSKSSISPSVSHCSFSLFLFFSS